MNKIAHIVRHMRKSARASFFLGWCDERRIARDRGNCSARLARLAVIWLHGLGADGHDFEPIVPELRLRRAVRFVFPHAPVRPVTINNGHEMRAWYDIAAASTSCPKRAGIRERGAVRGVDRRARSSAASRRSGSCSRASRRAARSRCRRRCATTRRLAGVLALSTYLPLAATLASESLCGECRACRIFMAHGSHDPVIPVALADASRRALEAARLRSSIGRSIRMPHSVCAPEVAAIGAWLSGLRPARGSQPAVDRERVPHFVVTVPPRRTSAPRTSLVGPHREHDRRAARAVDGTVDEVRASDSAARPLRRIVALREQREQSATGAALARAARRDAFARAAVFGHSTPVRRIADRMHAGVEPAGRARLLTIRRALALSQRSRLNGP